MTKVAIPGKLPLMTATQRLAAFEGISVSWRIALDDAQAALVAAVTILTADDTHDRARRLADERTQIARLLETLVTA